MIVAVVFDVTAFVAIANVAVLLPSGTVTVVETTADPLFDVRVTTSPPGPASQFKVTVPVDVVPPTTELGESEMLATPAGTTPT